MTGLGCAAHEASKGSQPALALLQEPSGRIAYRLPLDAKEPLTHAGYQWVWSHRCRSGVTYARGCVVVVAGDTKRG
jgi:hypothetical protein